MDEIRAAIRDIPDFPKPGIIFKDITPILQDAALFKRVNDVLIDRYRGAGITQVLAMESRGFIFAGPLSNAIGAGFIPLRKPGKLPYKTIAESYELEYGTATLEMHEDALVAGDRVLILDDLLATGGTAEASVKLARTCGAEVVEAAFVVELTFLNGRDKLQGVPIHSLIQY